RSSTGPGAGPRRCCNRRRRLARSRSRAGCSSSPCGCRPGPGSRPAICGCRSSIRRADPGWCGRSGAVGQIARPVAGRAVVRHAAVREQLRLGVGVAAPGQRLIAVLDVGAADELRLGHARAPVGAADRRGRQRGARLVSHAGLGAELVADGPLEALDVGGLAGVLGLEQSAAVGTLAAAQDLDAGGTVPGPADRRDAGIGAAGRVHRRALGVVAVTIAGLTVTVAGLTVAVAGLTVTGPRPAVPMP